MEAALAAAQIRQVETLAEVGRTYRFRGIEVTPAQAYAVFSGKPTKRVNEALYRLAEQGRLSANQDFFRVTSEMVADCDHEQIRALIDKRYGSIFLTRLAVNTLSHYFDDPASIEHSKQVNKLATEVMESAKTIPAASTVFGALVEVAHHFFPERNQALLSAAKATKQVTGVDLPELLGTVHLIAEKQTRCYSPTELGKRIGISAIKFNQTLMAAGLQYRNESKDLVPTEAGKRFAVLLDTGKKHSNGTPVQQLKWTEDVLDFVQKQSA